jgi:hypothetical protein
MRGLALLVALLVALLAACGDAPTGAAAPSIEFLPASVAFSARQPGGTAEVRARVRGFGPAPVLRWTSLAPDAIVVAEVREGGAVVVLRAAAPRATGVVLRVSGTATLADTLPVAVAGAAR